MARLFAVAAKVRVHSRLGAVASAMSSFVADDAGNDDPALGFGLLLFAVLADMAHLTAVVALGNKTIHGKATALQALEIFFWGCRPPLKELLSRSLAAESEGQDIPKCEVSYVLP